MGVSAAVTVTQWGRGDDWMERKEGRKEDYFCNGHPSLTFSVSPPLPHCAVESLVRRGGTSYITSALVAELANYEAEIHSGTRVKTNESAEFACAYALLPPLRDSLLLHVAPFDRANWKR